MKLETVVDMRLRIGAPDDGNPLTNELHETLVVIEPVGAMCFGISYVHATQKWMCVSLIGRGRLYASFCQFLNYRLQVTLVTSDTKMCANDRVAWLINVGFRIEHWIYLTLAAYNTYDYNLQWRCLQFTQLQSTVYIALSLFHSYSLLEL
jgi:hypothetical protein